MPRPRRKINANTNYWYERELLSYQDVHLHRDRLASHADQLMPAVGRVSRGYSTHASGVELADMLGRTVIELPGGIPATSPTSPNSPTTY